MYVIELMADGDLALDSVYSTISQTHYLFCKDNKLYETLYDMLEQFKGTKLDNCFYDILGTCDVYAEEQGNYSLTVTHSRIDVGTIKNAFTLLCEQGLI